MDTPSCLFPVMAGAHRVGLTSLFAAAHFAAVAIFVRPLFPDSQPGPTL